MVAIFTDPFLREALRFRGGTALNKLHFPAPLRYSEDIDLVRTEAGRSARSWTPCVSSSSRGLDTVSTSQVRSHPS
ncbi:nucleotidyl transferase AbiEii/AbiGii toxin family protein [Rhizobium leguminosarum]|uniref:nucleotidyl transferase AbiEii/AbiGii toxin family protein n=1 Tax=Rhizobium leguminosarum TaxID=384 RepID=UPI0028C43B3D|nr:nucleotidyl transferase AbiEii/AbiGii toxin family protein [Rhizobium leguminosarum]